MKQIIFCILVWMPLLHAMENYRLPERRGHEPIGGRILVIEDVAGFKAGEYTCPLRVLDIELDNSPRLVYSKFHWLFGKLTQELGRNHPHTKLVWEAGVRLKIIEAPKMDPALTLEALLANKPTIPIPKKNTPKSSLNNRIAQASLIVAIGGIVLYGISQALQKFGSIRQ